MSGYLIYVDDSGDQTFQVFTGLIVPFSSWHQHLEQMKVFRRRLLDVHGIPVDKELHANEFLNGRGRPSLRTDAPINTDRRLRRQVGAEALDCLQKLDDLAIITAATKGMQRAAFYDTFLREIERHLEDLDATALIILDGDGTDPTYQQVHRSRKLHDRRIIEDPMIQTSHESLPIQFADLVAYCAYQHLADAGRRAMKPWYQRYVLPHHPPTSPDITWV